MILLWSLAFAGQGLTWVVEPHHQGSAIVGVVRFEPGTDPDDLSARVNGELVELQTEPARAAGITTIMSFDGSGSFRRFSPQAFAIARTLVEDAQPHDYIGTMVFGRKAEHWPATNDPQQVLDHLKSAEARRTPEQETRLAAFLLEAVDRVAEGAPPDPDRLRRVVVFTDAGEESEVFSPEAVIKRAHERRVIIDAVVFARPKARSFAEDLDRIARIVHETGGQLLEVHGPADANSDALRQGLDHVVRVRATYCGDPSAAIELFGPRGFHSTARVAVGTPAPCPAVAAPTLNQATPKRFQPPTRLSGLLCLLLLVGTVSGLVWVVWVVASRKEPVIPTAEPTPTLPPPPPSTGAIVDTAEASTYSSAFNLNLPETHLEVVAGDLPAGTRWRFAGRLLRLGALEKENDIFVDLPQVSSNHAEFELFPSGDVFVKDLGSANGTYVDGTRLVPHSRSQVLPGQRIALSNQLTLIVRSGSDA